MHLHRLPRYCKGARSESLQPDLIRLVRIVPRLARSSRGATLGERAFHFAHPPMLRERISIRSIAREDHIGACFRLRIGTDVDPGGLIAAVLAYRSRAARQRRLDSFAGCEFQLLRTRLNVALDLRLVFARGGAEIVGALQVQPKLRIYAKIAPKAQGCVCADRTSAIDDLRDAVRWHTQRHRELVRVHVEGL